MIPRLALLVLVLGAGCRTYHPPPGPPPDTVPSAAWEELLAQAVGPAGVDYDLVEERRDALDRYVSWLARRKAVPRSGLARFAHWLNAYNALSIWLVLELDRPESITDPPGWFPAPASGFFYEHSYTVGRDRVSLWDIHHERIRMRELDYRAHAAISCPARSCPPMRPELYEGSKLRRQLDDQMRVWVASGAVAVDGDVAVMSPILRDRERDFLGWTGKPDLCAVFVRHAAPPLRGRLRTLSRQGCPRQFLEWDWTLNHAPAPRAPPPE